MTGARGRSAVVPCPRCGEVLTVLRWPVPGVIVARWCRCDLDDEELDAVLVAVGVRHLAEGGGA